MSCFEQVVRRGLVALATLLSVLPCPPGLAVNWNYLDGPFGGQPLALTIDGDGNTWAGLNGSGVYVRESVGAPWLHKPGLPTQSNARIRVDSGGTAYVTGSGGFYALKAGETAWRELDGTAGLPSAAAGGLYIDDDDTVYVAVNASAIYKRAAGATNWTSTGTGLPDMANNIIKDASGNFWASVGGTGVYRLAPGSATWVAVSAGLPAQPKLLALLEVGNDLLAGIQFGGVYKLANAAGGGTTWSPFSGGAMAADDAVYAFARSEAGTIYAAGYGEVYSTTANSSAWSLVGTFAARFDASYSLVWSEAEESLTLGNGSGIFVLAAGETEWQAANDGMTAATTYDLAMTANGDLYAATFGQGVQRQEAGTTNWVAVDPAGIGPVVNSLVLDQQGTLFAASGGEVKRFDGDAWQDAGSGLAAFAYRLALTSANAILAGESGAVQRLEPGSSTWVTLGTGLPAGRSVTALATDSGGTTYAGFYGNGIWSLAPGAATWTQINSGLPDTSVQALLRGPGGVIHAGVGDGVYALSGGVWSKVGTHTFTRVYRLGLDADGTLYAGLDNDYIYRLPAGAAAWEQIRAGLDSRTVYAILAGGGRLYVGTDASRGSRSGVYALWTGPTVVEFYNTLLDNFFITANADEQAAIQGGSAGPGWIVTGNAFSAGGPAQVCRFYGSIVPGPNSHFYTIDPAECQQLKDLQASTPPTEKRWNFESYDFASTPPDEGGCPAGTLSVFRAYNDGFSRGVDSNHRITASYADYALQVAHGWQPEGVVMCAPR
jgi:hypothetical protein